MKFLFSGENAKLKTMNQILTDAARKRTNRIEQLEDQVAQLSESLRKATERLRELESERDHLFNEKDREQREAAIERDHLFNEKDREQREGAVERDHLCRELAVQREAAVQRAHLLNEKDRELAAVREVLTECKFRIRDLEGVLRNSGQRGDSGAQPECGSPHVGGSHE